MNSHASPCDHMIFVAKSSPKRTWVPRRVTDRLTVRRHVNINPGRPRTSSTAAPRKPQHHHLRSPICESKSFFFLKRAHGVKRAIQEVGEGGGSAALPYETKKVLPPPPAEPEQVPLPTPAQVKPPPPEEVKPPPPKVVKTPRHKVARQPVAAMRAPALSAQDASWSAKLLHEAFVKLGKVAVHLGVQPPSHLL
jgi:hypothetical protein